jgi:hypothetical protein
MPTFVGRSSRGNLADALDAAVQAARRGLNSEFFTWKLDNISGSVGGFAGVHDIVVAIVGNSGVNLTASRPGGGHVSGNWHAWHDWMPGKPPTLHVSGTVLTPCAGYTVTLKPAAPQGINPAIYMLDLIVTPPRQASGDVLTPVDVHYQEITSFQYTEVFILPDGVAVPVIDVS